MTKTSACFSSRAGSAASYRYLHNDIMLSIDALAATAA